MKESNSSWVNLVIFIACWMMVCGALYTLAIMPYGAADQPSHLNEIDKGNFTFIFSVQCALTIGTIMSVIVMYKFIDLRPPDLKLYPLVTDIMFGTFIGAGSMSLFALYSIGGESIHFEYSGNLAPLFQLFVLFALVAVAEELLVRGYILNNLLLSVNPSLAIGFSSLFFALLHLLNDDFNYIGFVNLFAFGVVAALLCFKSKNISLPIGFHFGWNYLQGILGLTVSGHKIKGIFTAKDFGNYLVTGGTFGPEASIITTLELAFLIAAIGIVGIRKKRNDSIIIKVKNSP